MNPAQAIGTISAAGKEAGRAGRPHTANPHAPDSREAMAWFESCTSPPSSARPARRSSPACPTPTPAC